MAVTSYSFEEARIGVRLKISALWIAIVSFDADTRDNYGDEADLI